MDDKQIRRGDIFYVSRSAVKPVGCEQFPGRPAVIVSCNTLNRSLETVEVVYLTRTLKEHLKTHVVVKGTGLESAALVDQITTVSVERLGDYCGHCSDAEMEEIDSAIVYSLGLDIEKTAETEEYTRLRMERDIYRRMYNELVDRLARIPEQASYKNTR